MAKDIPNLRDWKVNGALMFYSRGRGEPEYRDLSNFAPSELWLPARFQERLLCDYPDVETAFQAAKATDWDTHNYIWKGDSGDDLSPMASKKRGGNRSRVKIAKDWDRISPLWMLYCLRAKYQIDSYRQLLLSTGSRILVEDSPRDDRWGGFSPRTGSYSGSNLLGRALMRVRAEMRGEMEPAPLPWPDPPARP